MADLQNVVADAQGNTYTSAATTEGPYEGRFLRTTDLGKTWSRIEAPASITSVVPDPVDPLKLFGLSPEGIYLTLRGGGLWRRVYNGFASSLAIDPANRRRVAAIGPAGLLRSLDGGETWSVEVTSPVYGTLVADPGGSGALLVVAGPPSISRDWGVTVQPLALPSLNSMATAAFDPTRRGWIWAAGQRGSQGSLFLSTDFGATWTEKTNPTGWSVQNLALDPAIPDLLVTSGPGGVWRSTDGAKSWTQVAVLTSLDSAFALVSRQCSPEGGLFAKVSGFGSYSAAFSLDFGATWQSPRLSYVSSVSGGGGCSFYVVRQPSTDVVVTKTGRDGTVSWSRFLGGADADTPVRLAVDPAGNSYVVGNTASPDFHTTLPRIGPVGPNAVFLAKLTPAGAVVFSVLIGAEQNNIGTAVAVDSARNIYVAGNTLGQQFPVTISGDRAPINYTGFIAKLSPSGTLLAATWLSPQNTAAYALAVDSSDRLILTGIGEVPGFPLPAYSSQFLARMDAALSRIDRVVYRTGNATPYTGLAVDSGGNPVLALNSYALSATPGAYESPRIPTPCRQKMFFAGPTDLSIEKLKADDWSTVYRSVIHAACDAQPRDLQLDPSGAPVVTMVAGPGLPLRRPGWGAPTCWPYTAAVAKLTPDGSALDYASYIPQHCTDAAPAISLPGAHSGPSVDGIANAFSGDPTAVVTGGLYVLTVSGVTLPTIGRASLITPLDPLPRRLGGVEVRFDATAAEILQVAPGRVVVIVPPRDLRTRKSRSVGIQVFVNDVGSNLVRMPLVDSLPGFLTADFLSPAADPGIGIAYALNADFTINSAENPAAAGSTITLFATGLGVPPRPLYASWKVGPSNLPPETVEPLPGFIPAVWQVKMTLPAGGQTTGVVEYRIGVRLSIAGFSSTPLASNGVSIFVK